MKFWDRGKDSNRIAFQYKLLDREDQWRVKHFMDTLMLEADKESLTQEELEWRDVDTSMHESNGGSLNWEALYENRRHSEEEEHREI